MPEINGNMNIRIAVCSTVGFIGNSLLCIDRIVNNNDNGALVTGTLATIAGAAAVGSALDAITQSISDRKSDDS